MTNTKPMEDRRDELTERIRRIGLDDGDDVIAGIWTICAAYVDAAREVDRLTYFLESYREAERRNVDSADGPERSR